MAPRVKPPHDEGRGNGAGTELVENLDLLRRRLARGQCADHGRARPRRLALLFRVRRRAHLRGRVARPRSALRARQRLGHHDASQADRHGRDMEGPDARRHQALCQGHRALYPPDVLGRAQRHAAGGARSGFDQAVPHALRSADAPSRTASRSRCRLTASRAWSACRSTPRPAVSIRTMRAR